MAKIGMEYVVMGKLNTAAAVSGATAVYTAARYMGPNAAFSGNPTTNDVKDYGDDRAVETDNSVTGGTISVEHNELTLEEYAYMLGHTLSNGAVVANTNDLAPFLGVGMVGKSKRNGARKYTAKFYYKTQFREPNDENATKQDSTSFSHTTIEGSLFELENGDWKDQKEFDTLAAAKDWLNDKVGLEELPSVVLSRSSVTLRVGDTFQLSAETTPEGETVTWASETTATATVADGLVEGKAAGTTNVTASITVDGTTYSAACAVNVVAAS